MQPKVSIIIPSYNRASIIAYTLDSVLNQTYLNWECIIVDDGSTDNTLDIIKVYVKKDERFYSFNRPKEKLKGPSSCRNFGVEQAKGDYVIFLDSDDLLAPFCLENRVSTFKKHKNCDFLVFQMESFKTDVPDYGKKSIDTVLNKGDYLKLFVNLNSAWKVTSPVYNIGYIKSIKGFDESLIIFEDFEIAIRAIINTNFFKVLKEVDCYYRNNEAYFEKQITFNFIKKVVNAFEQYCYAFHKKIVLKEQELENVKAFKCSLLNNYKRVFKTYIIQFTPSFFYHNEAILNFLNANGYLSFVDKIKFYAVKNIFLRFHRFKGYGLFRVINYLMK